jgi:hypothetical protein
MQGLRASRKFKSEISTPCLLVAGRSKCTTHSTAGSGGDDGQRFQGSVSAEPKPGRQSLCEPFRAVVEAKLEAGLSAQCVYQDLLSKHGFKDSYESVKRYVRKLKAKDPARVWRIECNPGE